MDSIRPVPASLESFLQSDVASREGRFGEFLRDLAAFASEHGAEPARALAARAVSPLMDYSSLMKLRRHVVPGKGEPRPAAKGPRLAILGGPTTTQLRQLIELFLASEGIAATIYEADYGLFRQEILTPGSGLDEFGPTLIFLATGARDVAQYPPIDADEAAVAELAERELGDWAMLWETAASRWNATVLQNNFEIAPGDPMGHRAASYPASRSNYLERLNRLMAERLPAHVLLHDLRGLAAEAGARAWYDPRFYHEFKMPCGAECLVGYAHSVMAQIRAVVGKSKKVLVLDLDNTLWGGVVGDLGAGGIKLGQGSGEGEAFLAFQNYAKQLQQRGIILAVCSKNDDDKAREPFESRSDMALRLGDIACFVANWDNKADNLRAIADQLELKPDSLVFFDDNPAERAIVRRFAPEVSIPDVPEDPSGYIQALAAYRYFETVSFTREDTARSRYYAENARRKDLAAKSADLGSFLASLEMVMDVDPIGDLNIERATQLVNKSNQFNLTTRRYTLAQVREMAASPVWRTITLSLADRLGDNGLIGVILARVDGDVLDIDTWVMSCRVLQRGVERFARNELVEQARAAGCHRVTGTFIPTEKNQMVRDHYARLGFSPAGADGDQTRWSLDVGPELAPLDHSISKKGEPAHA